MRRRERCGRCWGQGSGPAGGSGGFSGKPAAELPSAVGIPTAAPMTSSQHLGIRPFLWVRPPAPGLTAAPTAPLLCQRPGDDHPEVSFPRVSKVPCGRDCGAQRLRDRPTPSASSG